MFGIVGNHVCVTHALYLSCEKVEVLFWNLGFVQHTLYGHRHRCWKKSKLMMIKSCLSHWKALFAVFCVCDNKIAIHVNFDFWSSLTPNQAQTTTFIYLIVQGCIIFALSCLILSILIYLCSKMLVYFPRML